MARRRSFNVISMSFLDAMTCGFGAVILFFMIISANVDLRSEEVLEDRSSEARRLELQLTVGRKNLAELRQALASMLTSMAETEAARDRVAAQIEETREELKLLLEDANASEETIEQLEADLAKLESETESLAAQSDTVQQTGNFIRQIRGEGYRQYLTGLRMGGERILILVDISTSMLDRTLVNVLRRRNMSREAKSQAPKWRQVVDTVDWLTAQIEPGTQFQVIVFNSDAWSIVEGAEGSWVTATDGSELTAAVDALRAIVPGTCSPAHNAEKIVDQTAALDRRDSDSSDDGEEGDDTESSDDRERSAEQASRDQRETRDDRECGATSLHAAFMAMNQLLPRPDNVFLLVDGLPTIGEFYPSRSGVTGRERYEHFLRASREVGRNIPINILLYALEGDPLSAPAYWTLALTSGGSLMAPSEDWP
jgi:hypothetical protein